MVQYVNVHCFVHGVDIQLAMDLFHGCSGFLHGSERLPVDIGGFY
jgi:hypothetical protein